MVQAQADSSVAGQYQLRGVMEMASGIWLKADSSFEFFFSYGAIDRMGKGRWRWDSQHGLVILNSAPKPPADFAMVKSGKGNGRNTTISVIDESKQIFPFITVFAYTAHGVEEGRLDSHGTFVMPKEAVSKIELVFELCAERSSVFTIADSSLRSFEFRIEPWFTEVFFNNVILQPDENGLRGGHPLMQGQDFHFHKLKPILGD